MPSHLPKVRRFHDLTPFRVREILLVSSPYDAFILEEDGQLSEQVFNEYRELSLSGPPRVTHVASGAAALARLRERRFDLILVMSSLAGMGVNAFGFEVKALGFERKPVVFLALDGRELEESRAALDPAAIDGAFLWSGDPTILLAIVKFVEDRKNVDHDIREGRLRVILVVEDSPRYYSSFLGLLYEELTKQARALYAEGVNELQRRMYMRSRPKILLATSYEEALCLVARYRQNLLAVIGDVEIPRGGAVDHEAGQLLARAMRQEFRHLPILLQSAAIENRERAAAWGCAFVDKRSPALAAEVRSFLRENLGFGDFIFRLADSAEVARATDLRDLERKLETVPEASIAYHAGHDHFSIWLMARSEFDLAEALRPKRLEDFPSVEDLRRYLIACLRDARDTTQSGEINDFRRESFGEHHFSRIGRGSLGGKARGIAFLNHRLALTDQQRFGGLPVMVPKTVAVTTEVFDEFVAGPGLRQFALDCDDDREIATRFLARALPLGLLSDLRFIVEQMPGPLAVRSSSVLEDSMHQPFAGIYHTLMIPNMAADLDVRLRELAAAIRLVYASTFFRNAKSYLVTAGSQAAEEKMGVIIQRVVGSLYGRRFYPVVSGVAQSHNFYPIGPQRAEDGVLHLALGLGRTVVDGGLALRVSPRHPGVAPQLASRAAILKTTQRSFYAIDVTQSCCEPNADLYTTLKRYELAEAEADGTLGLVASVFSQDDQCLRDGLAGPGPRVVTFRDILEHRSIPLAEALAAVLEIAREGLGCPVEIEFACDLGDYGRRVAPGGERRAPLLYALQVRPFAARPALAEPARLRFTREDLLCASTRSLGHGVDEAVHDIVYVRPDTWRPEHNKAIAREVGRLNRQLGEERRPYLLIGPGRWGTSDEWLGIPVQWAQINNVRVIIEAAARGHEIEPSQGTHFFQNITSLRIGYLTLPPGAGDARRSGGADFLDWDWLEAQPAAAETEHLRRVRLAAPLIVALDGRTSHGVVAKPGARREG